jgi:hypothetical protein
VTAPLARSPEEAHLFMELHPCACGAADFDRTSSVAEVDGGWLVRYEGRCTSCGRDRVFEFRRADETAIPAGGGWAPGTRPSELLDAGEWLLVADAYGSVETGAHGSVEAGRSPTWRTDLLAAAAALDEVLKFVPAGAETVPDDAFWTARGRAVRDAEPGRFRRFRLEAGRAAYRAAVEHVRIAPPG